MTSWSIEVDGLRCRHHSANQFRISGLLAQKDRAQTPAATTDGSALGFACGGFARRSIGGGSVLEVVRVLAGGGRWG